MTEESESGSDGTGVVWGVLVVWCTGGVYRWCVIGCTGGDRWSL